MGSGASSSTPSTPELVKNKSNGTTTSNGTNGINGRRPSELGSRQTAKAIDIDSTHRHLVRTNEVAPVIIKNCNEEYQHVTEFTEPIVYGRIAEHLPEHPLIKDQYFLVRDVDDKVDRMGTLHDYNAPNVRKCRGNYTVYGMGQPSKDGLDSMLNNLKDEGHTFVLVLNLRRDAVLFSRVDQDMVPYSLRHPDDLTTPVAIPGILASTRETNEFELQTRKQVMGFASLKEHSEFSFYNDIHNFIGDPVSIRCGYEDDLAVTDEIYNRLTFDNPSVKYCRIPIPLDGSPMEHQFNTFVNVFRRCPAFRAASGSNSPAVIVTSHSGTGRATLGMVMSCLMLAQQKGFPHEASKTPPPCNEESPDFSKGEFSTILSLCELLPEGYKRKHELDTIIDLCDELHNLRTVIADCKQHLDEIQEDYNIEGYSAKRYLLQQCIYHIQRYFYLICFNTYLHEQYSALFQITFTSWMSEYPDVYHLLAEMDTTEANASMDLINTPHRHLVADEHIYMDELSSQMDVKVSNFRRVPGLPVYGMAQPNTEGLTCVLNYLLHPKRGHPLVMLINLRQDVVVECDGSTYGVREADDLERPILISGVNGQEIEAIEEDLKAVIVKQKSFEVYNEVVQNPVPKTFTSINSPIDIIMQQPFDPEQFKYHHMPICDDRAPKEVDFDCITTLIRELPEFYSDEDGPAVVFHCRTGKGRTTTALAIAGLVVCHIKGFPYGTKPGEEESVSLPNAGYTKGNYKIVDELVRSIPNGQQVKREVDFILDQISDTMTPMHYHVREVIYVAYNKIKKAKTPEEVEFHRKRSLDFLERYIYLILFNTYLHSERITRWERMFTTWMKEVAAPAGIYTLIDNLSFSDFEETPWDIKYRRIRWSCDKVNHPIRGEFR